MYVYILLAIVVIVLYLTNIPSVVVEGFECQGEINLKSANDPKKATKKLKKMQMVLKLHSLMH